LEVPVVHDGSILVSSEVRLYAAIKILPPK
jgi:DNA integrity scanning protein DisA with diadenylate cyclase activity